MHKSAKITPILRKEIFERWGKEKISQRQLAREYHVDKRVVGKIIERGKEGDFSVHSSINKRYLKPTNKRSSTSRPKTSSLARTSRVKKVSSAKKNVSKKPARGRST